MSQKLKVFCHLNFLKKIYCYKWFYFLIFYFNIYIITFVYKMYAGIYIPSHSTMNQNKPMFVFLASHWTKFYEVFSYFIRISSHQYIETHYLWKNRRVSQLQDSHPRCLENLEKSWRIKSSPKSQGDRSWVREDFRLGFTKIFLYHFLPCRG